MENPNLKKRECWKDCRKNGMEKGKMGMGSALTTSTYVYKHKHFFGQGNPIFMPCMDQL